MKKKRSYSCDFETTTDPEDCRVWAWGLCEVGTENFLYGNSIQTFIAYIRNNCINQNLYFHNLAFDSQFILSYLIKECGYTWVEHTTDYLEIQDRTIETLISEDNVFYSITINFTKTKKITIYDSLKKLPFSVHDMALAFNLEEKKGHINYETYRPIGHELTEEEIDYLRNDVIIVAKALDYLFNEGLTEMTIASDSLKMFKKTIDFNNMFPIFDTKIDDFIRKSYRGGFTYVNKKYKNVPLNNIHVFDVNSLYPSAMADPNNLFPYDEPKYFTGAYEYDPEYPLYIIRIKCLFKLKENHIPCIQIKKTMGFLPTEYVEETLQPVELYLTSVDWEIFNLMYQVNVIEFIEGYKFKGIRECFTKFINYWNEKKIEAGKQKNKPLRTICKLILNSCYGKLATRTHIKSKYVTINENGILEFQNLPEETKEPIYTAGACFITAYARRKTLTSALQLMTGQNGLKEDLFIYADTDSLHVKDSNVAFEDFLEIDPFKLGAWKEESKEYLGGIITRGKFIRAKRYVEEHEISKKEYDDKIKENKEKNLPTERFREHLGHYYELDVKCAGMSDRIKEEINFDNFQNGFASNNKLTPKKVVGGVVLLKTPFTLKD